MPASHKQEKWLLQTQSPTTPYSMKSTFSYFKQSLLFSLICIAFAGFLGYLSANQHASSSATQIILSYMVSAAVLGVLETSVSLDNAVVNAKYLEKMNEPSRHWFLTWGMVIAVFGMRLVLPIAIVSIAAWIDPISAIRIALFEPEKYQHTMESVHTEVMGFGAGFLLMVTLEYFLNGEKENHWIPGLEQAAAFIGKFPFIQLLIGLPVCMAISRFAPHHQQGLLYSSVGGLLCFYAVHGLKELLESLEAQKAAQMLGNANGLMIGSLVFLEVLDASFSFDGVIAAFAITNQFLVVAAGLCIGAMFVRSLTVFLVEKGTMSELKYLENGAFFGIAWLVCTMFLSAYGINFGEIVVAGVAAGTILLSGLHSWFIRHQHNASEQ
ncbi:MAG: DUF475 domain-containing protein [Brachymonas sp.]|jgi:hypothetical protein|nr:DUF475 domain-containing protein [Brachymonas sp.]